MVEWVEPGEVRISKAVVTDDPVAEGWLRLVWARRIQTRGNH